MLPVEICQILKTFSLVLVAHGLVHRQTAKCGSMFGLDSADVPASTLQPIRSGGASLQFGLAANLQGLVISF